MKSHYSFNHGVKHQLMRLRILRGAQLIRKAKEAQPMPETNADLAVSGGAA